MIRMVAALVSSISVSVGFSFDGVSMGKGARFLCGYLAGVMNDQQNIVAAAILHLVDRGAVCALLLWFHLNDPPRQLGLVWFVFVALHILRCPVKVFKAMFCQVYCH